jgi:hypothetical protein
LTRRSDFERVSRDYYRTWDKRAVNALLPHLAPKTRFCEPCAGDGALVDQLTEAGHVCVRAWDIEPQRDDIDQIDATKRLIGDIDCFITNPPWSRPILHKLISHLSAQHPTWLLFDAAWKETKQSAPFINMCDMMAAVGRIRWIEGTKMDGKDDCTWYRFDARHTGGPRFVGRID